MKRYSEFEALYDVINMNFKNIDLNLPEFPSKFQVINREETRRNYFERLLNKIVEIYCEKITNETNRRLLSTIYVFMVGEQLKPSKGSPFTEWSSANESSVMKSSHRSSEEEKLKDNEKENRMLVHRKV
jgi:hypothetical protein